MGLIFAIMATRFIGLVYDQAHGYIPAFSTFLVISGGVLMFTLLFGFETEKPAHA